MYKSYILLAAALLFNVSFSQASSKIDSIGVENSKGKKVVLYRVEVKETYYSISKKYGVNYKDVMTYNDNKLLQIGVIIKVPTLVPFTATTAAPSQPADAQLTTYTIKAKDNLNMLAEKFGTTVNEIKRVNNLTSINLSIGQTIKIPGKENNFQAAIPETSTPVTATNVVVPLTSTAEHVIKAKENLNMLAEKYGTTVETLKRLNDLSSNNLRIGQVLKVPSANGETEPASQATVVAPAQVPLQKPIVEKPKSKTTATEGGFEHIVLAGETIYSIAKKYNLTTYQLKTVSNLSSNDVTVGQKILIKSTPPVAASTDSGDEDSTESNTLKDPSLRYAPSRYGLTQIEEKGTAIWIVDQDLDPSKMLILHRTAPVGTIIKITNPMSNRSTFGKVVGKFTENESTKDVIIVMTKAVADAVGALDKRFFCNITYGAQENEQ